MPCIIAQKFPNNEIRLKVVSLVPSRAGDTAFIRSLERKPLRVDLNGASVNSSGSTTTLDIISEFQRTPKASVRPGYGFAARPTRFGNLARRRILMGGAIIDREYAGNALFLTGTIPGSTQEAMAGLALWSGYAINRLNQWLKRRLGTPQNFGVWEFQKRGALHLHYVCASKNLRGLYQVKREFKSFWIQLLKDISIKSEMDLFERKNKNCSWIDESVMQIDAQFVEKSVAAYVSKYVSKEATQTSNRNAKHGRFFPTRFWCMSRDLLRRIKDETDSLTSSEVSHSDALFMLREFTRYAANFAASLYGFKDKYRHDSYTSIAYIPHEQHGTVWYEIVGMMKRIGEMMRIDEPLAIRKKSKMNKFEYARRHLRRWQFEGFMAELNALNNCSTFALRQVLNGRGHFDLPGYEGIFTCASWIDQQVDNFFPWLFREKPVKAPESYQEKTATIEEPGDAGVQPGEVPNTIEYHQLSLVPITPL